MQCALSLIKKNIHIQRKFKENKIQNIYQLNNLRNVIFINCVENKMAPPI